MLTYTHTQLIFCKSSYSSARGENCVEVAGTPGGAVVRDSQHPDEGHLTFPSNQWSALLGSARSDGL